MLKSKVKQSQTMEKQTENRLMDMGRGEERVRCMERVTWNLPASETLQAAGKRWLIMY